MIDETGRKYVRCWACGQILYIPLVPGSGETYKLFQCSSCNAYNEDYESRKPTLDPYEKGQKLWSRIASWIFWIGNRVLLVPAVLFLFGFEILIGIIFVLPLIFSPQSLGFLVSTFIALLLGFHTVYNYLMCLITKIPHAQANVTQLEIEKKSLTGYRFCQKCQRVKPPRSHHCSSCGICVPVLDHHCIFTGRCIGSHNHRYFLLFLSWLLASTIYIMIMCIWAAYKTPFLQEYFNLLFGPVIRVFTFSVGNMRFPVPSEIRLCALFTCELTIAFASTLGVGLLFYLQISDIKQGQTHFESTFEQPSQDENRKKGLYYLKLILGQNVWLWPWPDFIVDLIYSKRKE